MNVQVFDFVHRSWAFALDYVTAGNGYVREELEKDLSLLEAITYEGAQIAHLLTNRYKVLLLSLIDVTNGKKRQIKETPVIEEIYEDTTSNNIVQEPVVADSEASAEKEAETI